MRNYARENILKLSTYPEVNNSHSEALLHIASGGDGYLHAVALRISKHRDAKGPF